MTIGQRIKQRREELGMTQDELAKKCGYVGRANICSIESDRRNVPRWKMEEIALALDIEMSELFGVDNEAVELANMIMELPKGERNHIRHIVEEKWNMIKAER